MKLKLKDIIRHQEKIKGILDTTILDVKVERFLRELYRWLEDLKQGAK